MAGTGIEALFSPAAADLTVHALAGENDESGAHWMGTALDNGDPHTMSIEGS